MPSEGFVEWNRFFAWFLLEQAQPRRSKRRSSWHAQRRRRGRNLERQIAPQRWKYARMATAASRCTHRCCGVRGAKRRHTAQRTARCAQRDASRAVHADMHVLRFGMRVVVLRPVQSRMPKHTRAFPRQLSHLPLPTRVLAEKGVEGRAQAFVRGRVRGCAPRRGPRRPRRPRWGRRASRRGRNPSTRGGCNQAA